jgi:hypothetical protein
MASIRIESRIISWAMTDSERTISFNTVFEDVPVVCAMVQIYSASDASSPIQPANVNTYISQVTKTTVSIGTSGIFSGSIHLQAVDKTW